MDTPKKPRNLMKMLGFSSRKGISAAGIGMGAISAIEISAGLSSLKRNARGPVVSNFVPSIGKSNQTLNLGIDPMAGMRFSTRRRRFGGF